MLALKVVQAVREPTGHKAADELRSAALLMTPPLFFSVSLSIYYSETFGIGRDLYWKGQWASPGVGSLSRASVEDRGLYASQRCVSIGSTQTDRDMQPKSKAL